MHASRQRKAGAAASAAAASFGNPASSCRGTSLSDLAPFTAAAHSPRNLTPPAAGSKQRKRLAFRLGHSRPRPRATRSPVLIPESSGQRFSVSGDWLQKEETTTIVPLLSGYVGSTRQNSRLVVLLAYGDLGAVVPSSRPSGSGIKSGSSRMHARRSSNQPTEGCR